MKISFKLEVFSRWDKLNAIGKRSDIQPAYTPSILLYVSTFRLFFYSGFAVVLYIQHKSVQNIGQCYSTTINHMLNAPSHRVCCKTQFRKKEPSPVTLQWVCSNGECISWIIFLLHHKKELQIYYNQNMWVVT